MLLTRLVAVVGEVDALGGAVQIGRQALQRAISARGDHGAGWVQGFEREGVYRPLRDVDGPVLAVEDEGQGVAAEGLLEGRAVFGVVAAALEAAGAAVALEHEIGALVGVDQPQLVGAVHQARRNLADVDQVRLGPLPGGGLGGGERGRGLLSADGFEVLPLSEDLSPSSVLPAAESSLRALAVLLISLPVSASTMLVYSVFASLDVIIYSSPSMPALTLYPMSETVFFAVLSAALTLSAAAETETYPFLDTVPKSV